MYKGNPYYYADWELAQLIRKMCEHCAKFCLMRQTTDYDSINWKKSNCERYRNLFGTTWCDQYIAKFYDIWKIKKSLLQLYIKNVLPPIVYFDEKELITNPPKIKKEFLPKK